MAAYVIALRTKLTDAAEMAAYTALARRTFPPGTKVLAAYGQHETPEGAPVEGAVVIEFPSFEIAQAWYRSPAYQAALQHRFAGAEFNLVIVDGLG
ncbi:MAG: DUF1330 domain-containing protein [Hyphomonadaceae bacterium]